MVKLAVATSSKDAISETFIHAQIDRLPADVKVLYGGEGYRFYFGDEPLLKDSSGRRAFRKGYRRLRRLPYYYFEKQAIKRFLVHEKIEVVLAQYGNIGILLTDACVELGIPLVVHFHGWDAYNETLLARVGGEYSRLFQLSAAVVVVSRDMEQQVIQLGAPRKKVYYNPYGVSTDDFIGSEPDNSSELFLAVGRFVEKKAPYLTLLAFSRVHAVCKQARLIFIGAGPLLSVCKTMAVALGINSSVDFLGAQPHNEVMCQMRNARAFVQHSIVAENGDAEGTPVAVIEASASGLPVIATRHKGIGDVVIEGETGFLVDEGDVEGMAQSMILLAKDPQLAAQMGQTGRRRIEEHFSMDSSISRLWEIIKSAMDNAKAGHIAR